MSYVTAFWVGGLICALCQILLGKNKTDAGTCDGDPGLQRSTAWSL